MTRRTFFKSSALLAALSPVFSAKLKARHIKVLKSGTREWLAWEIHEMENIIRRRDELGFQVGFVQLAPSATFLGVLGAGAHVALGQTFEQAGFKFRIEQISTNQDGLIRVMGSAVNL